MSAASGAAALWTAWSNLLTAWETVKLLLPNHMASKIRDLDAEIQLLRASVTNVRQDITAEVQELQRTVARLETTVRSLVEQAGLSRGMSSIPLLRPGLWMLTFGEIHKGKAFPLKMEVSEGDEPEVCIVLPRFTRPDRRTYKHEPHIYCIRHRLYRDGNVWSSKEYGLLHLADSTSVESPIVALKIYPQAADFAKGEMRFKHPCLVYGQRPDEGYPCFEAFELRASSAGE